MMDGGRFDDVLTLLCDYVDAARIDGLSEPAIFIHMYMPIMKPSYAVAPIIMTGIVLATLPTGFLFFVMQKHFVAGMVGAVK